MDMRMTSQREIILKELQNSHQHLTADELYDRVKKIMPRISLATVYRNLETLSEAGLIGKLEISGRQKRFDFDVHPHDHIYCLECHRVDNIEFDRNLVNSAAVASDKGYRITGYRVEFKGICATCRTVLTNKEDGDDQ
jgi:Fur family ferric uptake transcriptional regulator